MTPTGVSVTTTTCPTDVRTLTMIPSQRRTANRHPELAAQIRRVLRVTAIYNEAGMVVLCQPRPIELRFHPKPGHPKWSANNGKVCFATRSDAERAADGLNVLAGIDPVASYECPRGGHWHHVSAIRRAWTTLYALNRIADAARRAREGR